MTTLFNEKQDTASVPTGPSQTVIYGMLAFCLVVWASAYCAIRIAVASYEAHQVSSLRFFFASVFLLLFVRSARLKVPTGREVVRLLCYGFCGISLYNILLCLGEQTVNAGTASFIIGIAPLFTALLAAVLLKEKIGKRGWIALFVAFVGAGFMSLGSSAGFTFSPAILLLLGCAILSAISIILNKKILNTMRPVESTIYGVWAGTLFLLPFLPNSLERMTHAPLNATLACLFLGIFPAALGYLSWSYMLKYTSANKAARFLYLIPVMTALQSSFFLGEPPSLLESIGAVLTLLAVVSASPMVNTLVHPRGPVRFKFNAIRARVEQLLAECTRRKTCCDAATAVAFDQDGCCRVTREAA